MNLISDQCNPKRISPLALAFVGDAVFGLMVRQRLVCDANRPVNRLHKLSVDAVKASAQAEAAKRILPLLTEEETDVFKRGRNAHNRHTPKNQSEGDYHYATGLEALFGYLYLQQNHERLRVLFDEVYESGENQYAQAGEQTAEDI